MLHCFMSTHSWISCTLTTMVYSSRIIKAKLPRNHLANYMATNRMANAFAQLSIYGILWRGLFTCKSHLHLQISARYEQLSRQHRSTSLQRSYNYLWNQWHVKLLHFNRLGGFLYDTRSHDFSHVIVCMTIGKVIV